MFSFLRLSLLILISFVFISCGGSNNNTTQLNETVQGTVYDDVIVNLRYKTEGYNSITDSQGRFYYNKGKVEFFLGNMKIGEISKITEDKKVFLSDMLNLPRGTYDNEKLIKLARILQTLDSTSKDDEKIVLDLNKTKEIFKIPNNDLESFDLKILEEYNLSIVSKDNAIREIVKTYNKQNMDIIKASNIAPLAKIKSEKVANIYESITFDGSLSSDIDGNITKYEWLDENKKILHVGKSYTTTYERVGIYTISLRVTDDKNDTSSTFVDIKVGSKKSVLSFSPPSSIDVVENQINVTTFNATDSENYPITYSIDGIDERFFTLDKHTGKIFFTIAPDYETKKTYTITIIASNGIETLSKNIDINIIDMYESSNNIFNQTNADILSSKILSVGQLFKSKSRNEGIDFKKVYKDYLGDLTPQMIQANIEDMPYRSLALSGMFIGLSRNSTIKDLLEDIADTFLGKLEDFTYDEAVKKRVVAANTIAFGHLLNAVSSNYVKKELLLQTFKTYLGDLAPTYFEDNLEAWYYKIYVAKSLINASTKKPTLSQSLKGIFEEYLGSISPEKIKGDEEAIYFRNIAISQAFEALAYRPNDFNETIKNNILDVYFQKANFFSEDAAFDSEKSISSKIVSFGKMIEGLARRPDMNSTFLGTFDKYLGELTPEMIKGKTSAYYYRSIAIGEAIKAIAKLPSLNDYIKLITNRYLGTHEDYKADSAYKNSIGFKTIAYKKLLEAVLRNPGIKDSLEDFFKTHLGSLTPDKLSGNSNFLYYRNLAVGKLVNSVAIQPGKNAVFREMSVEYLGNYDYFVAKNNMANPIILSGHIQAHGNILESFARNPDKSDLYDSISEDFLGPNTIVKSDNSCATNRARVDISLKLFESIARNPGAKDKLFQKVSEIGLPNLNKELEKCVLLDSYLSEVWKSYE